MKYIPLIAVLLLLIGCKEKKVADTEQASTSDMAYELLKEGSIEVTSNKLWSVIPEGAALEILAEGHDWTEGPLWIAEQEMLLYTDIPRNAIYSWKEGMQASVYLKPSGYLGENFTGKEPGANGLLLNAKGQLVLCQHGERRLARMNATLDAPKAEFNSLVDHYNGKRFNSPNDAVYSKSGDLYFTDPPYGLPRQMEDPAKELDFQGVYRLDVAGNISLLTDELTRPNGIALSPDEKKLYVANSDPEQAIWKVFDLKEDGTLGEGVQFYNATDLVPNEKGLPDGLKVDDHGNIFATGPGGVLIFSSEGELLGTIRTGQATSNCAFNTDKSALFITADSYLLRIKLR